MFATLFGAPEVSKLDLAEAYRPICKGYLTAAAVYFIVFSILHLIVIGGWTGAGLSLMSAATAAYCLVGRHLLRRDVGRAITLELLVLGHNLLLMAGLGALLALRYSDAQLAYLPIMILAFALVSPTARTTVASLAATLAVTAAVTPPADLAGYGYVLGVATFGSMLASTLLQMALRREIHMRRQLMETGSEYRMIAENIGDVILKVNADGIVEYMSPSVRKITGYGPEAWIGRHVNERVVEIDDRNPHDRLMSTPSPPSGRDNEFRIRRADGTVMWAQGNPTVMRDANGQMTGILTVVRDVTERRAVEDELRRKTAEAESAVVAKSEFLANMSHEIRTPLTGVLGFAELLQALPDLSEAARSYARRIATSGRALLSVVNDILDFSKLEAESVELDPHPFDPAALVTETVALFAAEAGGKGLSLTSEIDGEAPDAVLADGARLRQVLMNLLSNAIKFTETGAVRVTMAYQPDDGGGLRIAVADTGSGIPPDRADRLFQRFSQVDSSNTRLHGGTGLGLAISKSLVELMGGAIGVESREGHGSTFWLTLPAPATAPQRSEPVDIIATPTPAAAEARLLLVDDVAMNRDLVRTMLAPFRYEITEAANGAEAVSTAMSARFDLILMDLQMPGMDGLAATRAIRATSDLNRDTPILALSANVLPAQIAECRSAGMDDHIAKPISPADLLTKIAQWAQPQDPDAGDGDANGTG